MTWHREYIFLDDDTMIDFVKCFDSTLTTRGRILGTRAWIPEDRRIIVYVEEEHQDTIDAWALVKAATPRGPWTDQGRPSSGFHCDSDKCSKEAK